MTMKQTARINALDKRIEFLERHKVVPGEVTWVPETQRLADLVSKLENLQHLVDSLTDRVGELERKRRPGRPRKHGQTP